MSAYLVADLKIIHPEAFEEYKRLAKPMIEKFGGRYRARGGAMDVRETDLWSPHRMVIIEFPDMQSARAFFDSDEYASIKPLRTDNAESTLFMLDGV